MATVLLTTLVLSVILLTSIVYFVRHGKSSDCNSCEYCLNQQSEVERPVV